MKITKTFLPDLATAEKKCYVFDAADQILGRVAAKAAHYLRGKHRKDYTPNFDSGDLVVIINADKIKVTGKKLTDKIYQRYSGYPSGQRRVALGDLMKIAPTQAMREAVDSMIPKGPLGNATRRRLRIYVGNENPHTAQKPIVVTI
ncbi:MAG: 50S ribosomal protein L13 [Candidatus Omnitrophica bacterium]|jgi:large subunit ribosomal protein L13|nr:50S ribosomal protein L13 [Candidatus Omnitrophota bacterium]